MAAQYPLRSKWQPEKFHRLVEERDGTFSDAKIGSGYCREWAKCINMYNGRRRKF